MSITRVPHESLGQPGQPQVLCHWRYRQRRDLRRLRPNYSLRQNAYNESCSTCGLIFFQYKMNLAYHDARYADLYEESLYNALLGSMDLEGKNFYYDNPLDSHGPRYPWHACPCCVATSRARC